MKICPSLSSPVKSLQSFLIFPFPWWPISSWPFQSFSFLSISFLFPGSWSSLCCLSSLPVAGHGETLCNTPDSSPSAVFLVNHRCLRKTQSKHVFSAWPYVTYWNTKAAEIDILPSRKWQGHGKPSHSTWPAYLISFPSLLTRMHHPHWSLSPVTHFPPPGTLFASELSSELSPAFSESQFSCELSSITSPEQKDVLPWPRPLLDQLAVCLLPLLNRNLYSCYHPGTRKEYGDKRIANRSKKRGIKMCCWV